MDERLLDDIVASGRCSGCGLCGGISGGAVEMRLTRRGFLRPHRVAPLSQAALETIAEACPGSRITGPADDGSLDPIWGPVRSMRRAWADDAGIRFRGSSGGAITAVLVHLLERNEVDAVLHIGIDPERPAASAAHVSRTAEEAVERAGSRYAPSATLAEIGAVLDRFERLAVVGKPCDIAALRAAAPHDPRIGERVRYMISFFCAGVPSLKGTRILLEQMGIPEAELARLRYRGDGWPGAMVAVATDGREGRRSYLESWGTVLHRHLQFRCKICPDGTGEAADLVAADAWITADGYPDFDERPGVSAVVARTDRGDRLLRACIDAGVLRTEPLTSDELVRMQPYQVDRKRTVVARLAAMAVFGQARPRYRRLRLLRNGLHGGRDHLRNFVGTALRLLQGRHRE